VTAAMKTDGVWGGGGGGGGGRFVIQRKQRTEGLREVNVVSGRVWWVCECEE